MTVATASGQLVNEGRVKRAGRSDFSTCAATLSFQRRKPPSTKGTGASVTVQVPPPQCVCRFPVWVQTSNSHHKPWWTAGEADKVAPTLALGLKLGGGGEGEWLGCTMPWTAVCRIFQMPHSSPVTDRQTWARQFQSPRCEVGAAGTPDPGFPLPIKALPNNHNPIFL